MIRLAVLFLLAVAAPLQAKQSLGVFGDWGAFRDALRSEGGPRCYAIAMPAPSRLQRLVDRYNDHLQLQPLSVEQITRIEDVPISDRTGMVS